MKISRISVRVLLLIVSAMVFSGVVCAYGFSDIEDSHFLAEDIRFLQEKGYVAGYPDGTFRPEGDITRAEFVRMINGIFGYVPGSAGNLFFDVQEGAWYYNDVLAALLAGYIIGYPDGTFRPQGNITKEEACAIFDRILSLDLHITEEQTESIIITDRVSSWADSSVRRVLAAGLMKQEEKTGFQAQQKINRGQVAYACARTLEKVSAKEYTSLAVPGMPGTPESESEYVAMIKRTIGSVTDIMNDNVLPENKLQNGNTEVQKQFLRKLRSNMQRYLNAENKENFDSEKLFKDTKADYSSLPVADREELKRVIQANVDVIDLSKLRDFFGF